MTIQENTRPLPIPSLLESLLFVADGPVSVKQLADTLQCDRAEIENALDSLQQDFQSRGLRLQHVGDRFQMVTAPEVSDFVERFLGLSLSSRLSTAALEALSIIAYKQPITRPGIDAIRGVNSDGVLRTLLAKGLVEEVGRLETVGHPVLYGTTFQFLQYFGLCSLAELPEIDLGDSLDGEPSSGEPAPTGKAAGGTTRDDRQPEEASGPAAPPADSQGE